MAETAVVIGAYLALVGPATEAITQIFDLGTNIAGTFQTTAYHGGVNNAINIGVGFYEGGKQDDFGGDPALVSGYTSEGSYIGTGHMSYGAYTGIMNAGDTYKTVLDGSGDINDVQARQLTVQNGGSNAVCIAYLELIWQQELWSGWTGDFGKTCGQDWYFSSTTWGKLPDGTPYLPACTWIDGDGTHALQEFSIDMDYMLASDNTGMTGDRNATASYCDNAFKFSAESTNDHNQAVPGGLNADIEGSNASPNRRRNRIGPVPGKQTFQSSAPYPTGRKGLSPSGTASGTGFPQATGSGLVGTALAQSTASSSGVQQNLVVSEHAEHSAKELCDHPNSRGPDFISLLEELFCDMSEGQYYPLCSQTITTDCFSFDEGSKSINKRDITTSDDGKLHRLYDNIAKWSPSTASQNRQKPGGQKT